MDEEDQRGPLTAEDEHSQVHNTSSPLIPDWCGRNESSTGGSVVREVVAEVVRLKERKVSG